MIPAKLGCRKRTVSIILEGSLVSIQIGTASTSPKVLNSAALPSITGIAASGPISPRPSTRVPSLTIATILPRQVYSKDKSLFSLISLHGSATPGVYAKAKSSRVLMGTLLTTASLPWFSKWSFKASSRNVIHYYPRNFNLVYTKYCK